jgi:hypothetical protein
MNSVVAFCVGLVLGPIVAVLAMALVFVCMVLWHCNRTGIARNGRSFGPQGGPPGAD